MRLYVSFSASKVDNVEQLYSTVTTCNHLWIQVLFIISNPNLPKALRHVFNVFYVWLCIKLIISENPGARVVFSICNLCLLVIKLWIWKLGFAQS